MTQVILSRRRALLGLLTAPAIVAAPSLMRVSTKPATILLPLPPMLMRCSQYFYTEYLTVMAELEKGTSGITDLMRGDDLLTPWTQKREAA